MESAKVSATRILKSRAFLFLVVILLLAAVLGVTLGGSPSTEEHDLRAQLTASTTLARTLENVTFSAEGSRGDIATYAWDMGDGTLIEGETVVHGYEMGGWYNVTLTVTCQAGHHATDTVLVGIQPEDNHRTRDLPRDRDVRPRWQHGFGLLGDVGPHIAPPTSNLEYHVVRAMGTFRVYVEVWVHQDEGYVTTLLHEEEHTMTGQDLHFTYTVEPEDLPEEAALNRTQVHVSTMIDQGRWASSSISVDVQFPFQELVDASSEDPEDGSV
jgi:hypothetical protein